MNRAAYAAATTLRILDQKTTPGGGCITVHDVLRALGTLDATLAQLDTEAALTTLCLRGHAHQHDDGTNTRNGHPCYQITTAGVTEIERQILAPIATRPRPGLLARLLSWNNDGTTTR